MLLTVNHSCASSFCLFFLLCEFRQSSYLLQSLQAVHLWEYLWPGCEAYYFFGMKTNFGLDACCVFA